MPDTTQEDLDQNKVINSDTARIAKLEKDLADLKATVGRNRDWAQSTVTHLQNVVAPLARIEERIVAVEKIVEAVVEFVDKAKHKLGL